MTWKDPKISQPGIQMKLCTITLGPYTSPKII